MTCRWHIDALDARGGIAFGSFRPADLSDDLPDLDLPAVVIAPPAFVPEAIASRATALSATKGPFQFGFFVDKEEVGFPTLASLVEFVRRTYLASGGGDSGNGVGPGPPPPPRDSPEEPLRREGDKAEREEREDGSGTGAIVEAASILSKASEGLAQEGLRARPLDLHAGFESAAASPGNGAELTDAAALLIAEMLRHGSEAIDASWLDAAARLGGAVQRLGLWPLLDASYRTSLFPRAYRAARNLGPVLTELWHYADSSPQLQMPVVGLLFGVAPAGEDPWAMEYFLRHRPFRWWPWSSSRPHMEHPTDAMDDLSRWPVPAHLKPAPEVESLRDFVLAAAAAPQLAADGDAAALLLFGAVHLTGAGRTAPVVYPLEGRERLRRDAVASALHWLGRQFPTHAFDERVERLIEDAIALKSTA